MTTAKPLARYGPIGGALRERRRFTQLHHYRRPDHSSSATRVEPRVPLQFSPGVLDAITGAVDTTALAGRLRRRAIALA